MANIKSKLVYAFAEGNRDLKDLLGGKGANLAEMTRLEIPVPPGFIITTDACKQYLIEGKVPLELEVQVTRSLRLPQSSSLDIHHLPGLRLRLHNLKLEPIRRAWCQQDLQACPTFQKEYVK